MFKQQTNKWAKKLSYPCTRQIKYALCTETCLEQTTSGIIPLTVWGKPKLTLKCLKLKISWNEKQAGIPYGSWRSSPTHRPGKKI